MSVTVEDLTKSYGQQLALNNVSFSVNSGEIVGLIGPNGAGKSTLMKIICSLLLPTSGDVIINDLSVKNYPHEVKRHLGYLPENNPLYTDLYVKEYLGHVAGLYGAKNNVKRVDEVIQMTGLGAEMHKKIGLLSKGYKQRVGLAQAIIHDPDILILDEPTTGLDPNQIIEIRNLISELGKEKTVILSTHIMQEVEAICRRVIILNKGQVVANDLTGNLGVHISEQNHTIIVEFGSQNLKVDLIEKIQGVKNIKKLKDNTWLIESSSDADIRGDLFKYAVENELIILSMHRQDKRLEDVFRDLTS
ncbi:MAG TPA: ATP-binding cassette domain-containing protein [Bacteroidales bacterium]|nr:ATP-binding cassette domain-containing protein [Bacteroidales bacterium]